MIRAGALIQVAAVAVCFGACSGDGKAPAQPIAFNHQKHLSAELAAQAKQRPLVCTDCHPGAETKQHAGLPALSVCLRCHMRVQPASDGTASPEEAKVRELAAAPARFRWIQVTRNPAHVYFSHRAHVGIAKMTCTECHGDVSAWTEPPRTPNMRLRRMDSCMSCHRSRGASNDCGTCHR